MNKSNASADYPDAVNLWQSLKAYLKVDIAVEVPDNPQTQSQTKVKIIVTNTAPKGAGWPAIVFEHIQLETQRHVSRMISPAGGSGQLDSGQSLTYELTCNFQDLPGLQPKVDADVSRQRFFHVTQTATIASAYARPTVLKYIQAFSSMKFWDTFDPKLRAVRLPGPDTPFAQVQALTQQMTDSLASIETTIKSLSVPSSAAIGPESRGHLQASVTYLYEERRVRQELNQAIASADTQKITQTVNSIRNLEIFESAVNRAAEELVAKYSIPEQEAHGLWVS